MRAESSPNESWCRAISDVLRGVDTPEFPEQLARVLREIVPLDRAIVYVLRRDDAPLVLYADQPKKSAAAKRATELYCAGGYRFDPYYRAFLAGTASGFTTSTGESGVARRWQRAHHVAYLSPVSTQACVVALVVRTPGGRAFAPGELDRLRAVDDVLTSALRLHWKTCAERQTLSTGETDGMLRQQVEAALDRFGTCTLTPREGQVVRLLLRGHSTKAAAESLGIAVATTALHRKRAYAKLGVCSQAELFYLFIRSLTTPPRTRPAEVAAPRPRRARPALVQSSWSRAAASGAS
jgi:DNA-binding NarL/FixJ family response regulator